MAAESAPLPGSQRPQVRPGSRHDQPHGCSIRLLLPRMWRVQASTTFVGSKWIGTTRIPVPERLESLIYSLFSSVPFHPRLLSRPLLCRLRRFPSSPSRFFIPPTFRRGACWLSAMPSKIAVQYRASLSILHVESGRSEDARWEDFPGVRDTLQRWGLLPPDAPKAPSYDELHVAVEKIDASGPVIPAIINFLDHHPFDLMVLSTHGREGLPGWLHRSTAEPLARRALLPTLFVPARAKGFVSAKDGQVSMKRLLMPIDHSPSPRYAIPDALEVLEGLGDDESELTLSACRQGGSRNQDAQAISLEMEVDDTERKSG